MGQGPKKLETNRTRQPVTTKFYNGVAATIFLFSLLFLGFNKTEALRRELQPYEPVTQVTEVVSHLICAPKHYWLLGSQHLLNATADVPNYYQKIPQTNNSEIIKIQEANKDAQFSFNISGSTFFTMATIVRWYLPLEDRVSLNVFDSKKDFSRAFNKKRIDREKCALYLDYMLHEVENRAKTFDNTTDVALMHIMNSFGAVNSDIFRGATVVPGDYDGCMSWPLVVNKEKMIALFKARQEIKDISASKNKKRDLLNHWSNENKLNSDLHLRMVYKNIAKWFNRINAPGYVTEDEKFLMSKYKDQLEFHNLRFCYANIRWQSLPNSTFHKRNTVVKSGVCLPSFCDSSDEVVQGNKDTITKLIKNRMPRYFDGFYLDSMDCLPDEDSPLRNPMEFTSTKLFLAFNFIWLSVVFGVTLLMSFSKNVYSNSRLLKALNFGNNFVSLLKDEDSTPQVLSASTGNKASKKSSSTPDHEQQASNAHVAKLKFTFLRGLKVMSAASVISTHSAMYRMSGTRNPDAAMHILRDSWIAPFQVFGIVAVDSFYVMTGILTVYQLMRVPRKYLKRVSFWMYAIVMRYLRVVPMYLFMHWFLQSTFRFIGEGPFWDYAISHSSWAHICTNESWWTILLPTANFKSPSSTCNPVGWYLASDVQFFLVVPFFVAGFAYKPIATLISGSLLCLGLIITHIVYYMSQDFNPMIFFHQPALKLNLITDLATAGYVYPQFRFPMYFAGLAAGYFLFTYEQRHAHANTSPQLGLSSWLARTLKVGVIVQVIGLISYQYLSVRVPRDDMNAILFYGAIVEATTHFVYSLNCASFICLLALGYWAPLASFLSARVWLPFSRAALTTVLVHMPILIYRSQTQATAPHLNEYEYLKDLSSWWIESFSLALVLHSAYELPFRAITNWLLAPQEISNKLSTSGSLHKDQVAASKDDHQKTKQKQN